MRNKLYQLHKAKKILKSLRNIKIRDVKSVGKRPFKIHWWDVLRLRLTRSKKETKLLLNKHTLILSDAYWFLPNFKEIFQDEIYKFESIKDNPVIIDCGSNIGLSLLYFKHLFPKARISGYEPDPYLFEILKKNLSPYKFKDVTLIQKAVWKEDGLKFFHQDKTIGGKLISTKSSLADIEVPTLRLKDHLNEQIDMLKMDIEGAEYDVILDCSAKLENVRNIFVEYHGNSTEAMRFRHLLELLERSGFNYYIKEADPIMHPFIKQERIRTYDLQFNIFAFRD